MLRLISTISLRELRQTPLRALLMLSGIAAGVTLLTAVVGYTMDWCMAMSTFLTKFRVRDIPT